jgi:hypothetical protein
MSSRAYKQFFKLDESKYKSGEYIIMIDEKVVRHGYGKELKKLFAEVKREYPDKMPAIAKIPAEGVHIFSPMIV